MFLKGSQSLNIEKVKFFIHTQNLTKVKARIFKICTLISISVCVCVCARACVLVKRIAEQ